MTANSSSQPIIRPATLARIANMRTLIAAMRISDIENGQVSAMLNLGQTGSAKYTRDLRDAGIVEEVGRARAKANSIGRPIYHLVGTDEAIEHFLIGMSICKPYEAGRSAISRRARAVTVKADSKPVTSDPGALPRGFFAGATP